MQDLAIVAAFADLSPSGAAAQARDVVRATWLALPALPWPALAGIALAPLGLSLASRSGLAVMGSLLLVPLASVALAQGESPVLVLSLYAAALLLAVDGFRERVRRRALEEIAGALARTHRETDRFLDALDRRARAVDLKAAEARPLRHDEASASS